MCGVVGRRGTTLSWPIQEVEEGREGSGRRKHMHTEWAKGEGPGTMKTKRKSVERYE